MLSTLNITNLKEEYAKQLSSQLVTAIVVLDRNLCIQFLNSSAEALFSKSLNRLYQQPFLDLFIESSISFNRLQNVLNNFQEFTDSEVVFKFIDQHHITLEVTASVVLINNQQCILLECKQIDNKKQISAEAFQEQQWVAARDLIRGLAHEIKNPLGGLRGAAQLLDKELTSDQQEFTSLIIEQADRLTNLVDRLLGPNQLPQMEIGNIHQAIEKVFQLVSMDNAKNIKFQRDYDPSIPDNQFDSEQMQQVLLNIIKNAIQILPEGGEITLRTRIANHQTINGTTCRSAIQISVIDNGPGIPKHIQDTLFYPMVSGREGGTGLGLSIAQTLIHQHHGKLACHSESGRTEFSILLPLPKRTS
ncbi:nitrogen regulation protein NR(II) [Thalassotalea aquiviva]|uniref:nitrogen regulation protein NR(II) n=1 Tax=Thalassotalea aquiviva TaxID=3242415 RepID=UPI00352A78E0